MAWGWKSGYSESQSTSARLLHGGQAPRTRGGFDGETELIIAPEAPKAQSWLRRWGLEWMEAEGGMAAGGQGTCWVTHTLTEDGKLLIAMKHLC